MWCIFHGALPAAAVAFSAERQSTGEASAAMTPVEKITSCREENRWKEGKVERGKKR
jgi:hypothetical protein